MGILVAMPDDKKKNDCKIDTMCVGVLVGK
jgi:hypothetical protein